MNTARGVAWLAGAFLFCPCHLPLTLAALTAVLSGTAAAAWPNAHPYASGLLLGALWAAGTWRGLQHLRGARGCVGRSCVRPRTREPAP